MVSFKHEVLVCVWMTYGQDDVDKVHDGQDDDADAHMEVTVGQAHERSSEDVVCEHLRIVLALLLNVDDENLLDPEAPLDEIVPLEQAVCFPERPAFPYGVEVQPKLRVVHDVLSAC